jgi:hypothetical protein
MVDEKLISKIKGLLDTSTERGASEAEAATAARLVEGILTKHGLDLDDVRRECGKLDDGSQCDAFGVPIGEGTNEELYWLITLAHNVGNLCFCRSLVIRDGPPDKQATIAFVGIPIDREAAANLFIWLANRGRTLALAEWEKTQAPVQPVQIFGNGYTSIIFTTFGCGFNRDKDLFMRSFLVGYASRIGVSVQQRVTQRTEEVKISDLAVYQFAEADRFIEKALGKPPEATEIKPSTIDIDAAYRGQSAGANSPLEISPVLA